MACRHGLRYCRLSLILAITALLTAAVVGQGNQYPYHSDPILLTSVEPLGSLEDGRGRFYGGLIAGDLNEDGPVDVFGHVAVSWIQPGPEQPFVVLLNDGAGGLVDGTSTILAPPRPTGFGTGPALVGDYNGDGQNDVWVSSVGLDQGGNPDAGSPNWLLLSGPDGLLHDVSGEKLPQFKSFTHGPSAATPMVMVTSTSGRTTWEVQTLSYPFFLSTMAVEASRSWPILDGIAFLQVLTAVRSWAKTTDSPISWKAGEAYGLSLSMPRATATRIYILD